MVKTKVVKKLATAKKVGSGLAPAHRPKLGSVLVLTKKTGILLWQQKRIFIGLTLVYGLLNLVLAQGLSGTDIANLKLQLSQVFTGNFGVVTSSLVVFASLIGSAGNTTSNTAGAYQLFLTLLASLTIIWALRQSVSGRIFKLRDAYYKGMSPLIPFVLVLLVIGLELLPMAIGSTLYSIVTTQGIAHGTFEKLVWGILFGSLSLLSLYLLASSLFALYIVTLPDMTPLKALRSARELVRGRRWTVLRKVLFLPLLLLIVAAVIMLPFIIWATPLAKYVYFVLSMFTLIAVHGYMYHLYRDLLNE